MLPKVGSFRRGTRVGNRSHLRPGYRQLDDFVKLSFHRLPLLNEIESLQLRRESSFGGLRDVGRSHESLIGCLRCIVQLDRFRSHPLFRRQLHRGAEEIVKEPHSLR